MPQPDQFENTGATGFQPPKFQPIKPADVAEVKKSYEITEPKFTKSDSDKKVYDFSTKKVMDWYKKSKGLNPATAGGSLTSAQLQAILKQTGSTGWSPPTYAQLNEASLRDWIARATANQSAQILKAAGVPTWKPPAYALISKQALLDWIARAKANQGLS